MLNRIKRWIIRNLLDPSPGMVVMLDSEIQDNDPVLECVVLAYHQSGDRSINYNHDSSLPIRRWLLKGYHQEQPEDFNFHRGQKLSVVDPDPIKLPGIFPWPNDQTSVG